MIKQTYEAPIAEITVFELDAQITASGILGWEEVFDLGEGEGI